MFHSNVEGQWEVFSIPASGGKPRNLTSNPARDDFPSFSRDGRWIYFNSTRTRRTSDMEDAGVGRRGRPGVKPRGRSASGVAGWRLAVFRGVYRRLKPPVADPVSAGGPPEKLVEGR